MMRSLYSGVAGLKVHQTRMDVIGNNIANVNTVGFKSQTANFSELFYQTTQSASGPNAETATGGQNAKQIGLGASLSDIAVNISKEGGTQSTGNAFDLKINGSSFFVVQKGGTNYYTKAGNFHNDGYGNLVTSSGNYVMGYTAARDEESGDMVLQTDQLRPISVYGEEYMTTDPAQTIETMLTGNINSEDEKFSTGGIGYVTAQMNVYDSLGNTYSVMCRINNNPNDPTKYTMTPMYTEDKNGNKTYASVFKGNTALAGVHASFNGATEEASSIELVFNGTTGKLEIPNGQKGEFTLNITDGTNKLEAFTQDINVDYSGLTCFAGSTDLVGTKGNKYHEGAGKAVGTMIELGIQSDGKIIANYDNGDASVIGQILVAKFANAAGLQKEGDNIFSSTLNSGDPVINDISANAETMSSGVLEMSNVDLSDEFTNMIVTQRGFQANSRIITTTDTMIEELINLKR